MDAEAFKGIEREEEKYIGGTLVPRDEEEKKERISIFKVTPEDREEISKLVDFWEKRDWRCWEESSNRETTLK
jgi:hypothetical protein